MRHFEQRRVLRDTGSQVQLLVKPSMVGMYTTFDEVRYLVITRLPS